MTATISQFGRVLDFGNLSAGQRARVNFALSLAFRDVLQKLHPKINVCMLDEILDTALDSIGVQSAAKLIKQKAREESLSMFVISHRDEIDHIFDDKMIIQLKDGFSTIKSKYIKPIGAI
jgi:DNA repair exonuclease SbcCD ATPase subunit